MERLTRERDRRNDDPWRAWTEWGDTEGARHTSHGRGRSAGQGITRFLVPLENLQEARLIGKGRIAGIGSLTEAVEYLKMSEAEQKDGKINLSGNL